MIWFTLQNSLRFWCLAWCASARFSRNAHDIRLGKDIRFSHGEELWARSSWLLIFSPDTGSFSYAGQLITAQMHFPYYLKAVTGYLIIFTEIGSLK